MIFLQLGVRCMVDHEVPVTGSVSSVPWWLADHEVSMHLFSVCHVSCYGNDKTELQMCAYTLHSSLLCCVLGVWLVFRSKDSNAGACDCLAWAGRPFSLVWLVRTSTRTDPENALEVYSSPAAPLGDAVIRARADRWNALDVNRLGFDFDSRQGPETAQQLRWAQRAHMNPAPNCTVGMIGRCRDTKQLPQTADSREAWACDQVGNQRMRELQDRFGFSSLFDVRNGIYLCTSCHYNGSCGLDQGMWAMGSNGVVIV
jgi:hypothetical protein